MNRTVLISILLIFLLSNCKKSGTSTGTSTCSGLIIDTLIPDLDKYIIVPAAFSPNGDGINEGFYVLPGSAEKITDATFYDNNFNKVYKGPLPWIPDHKLSGDIVLTYHYILQYTTPTGHHFGKCGDVYLLSCRPYGSGILRFIDQIPGDAYTTVLSNDPIIYCR